MKTILISCVKMINAIKDDVNILIALILILLGVGYMFVAQDTVREEYTTETGLHCIRVDKTLTCDWERYLKKLRADQYEELKILKP